MNRADLGARAVACKGWRWMPGMRDIAGDRVLGVDGARVHWHEDGCYGAGWCTEGESTLVPWLPDLDDPPTLRCLLELVREAWGDQGIAPIQHAAPSGGYVWMRHEVRWTADFITRDSWWPSEAALLVAAL